MRKFLLIMFLMGAVALEASAQQEFANVELPVRRAEDMVSVADGDGNVCIYSYQSNKLYFNVISPTGEVIASHEIPYRYSQQPQIFGSRVTPDEFVFYSRYINGRREYVRPFAISRNTGAFRSLQDIEVVKGRGEEFMGGFADASHLYMLFSDRKGNLILHRDNGEGEARLEKKTFVNNMPKTRQRMERESQLIFVHPDLERNVFTGHHRSKMYTNGDKIFMIFDGYYLRGEGNKTTTEILTLDWNTGQSAYRALPAIEQKGSLGFNSFLHQGRLFRVLMDKEQLNLTAYDFNTLQPLKEYSYTAEEEIAIKATPVYQRGVKGLFSSDTKVLEKTSKVMKNLASGVPAITVDAFSDSTIQLTIGSYEPPQTQRNGDPSRMVRTPDRYVSTSRGLMMIPGRWVPAYSLPYSYGAFPGYYYGVYDPFRNSGSGASADQGISTYFRAVLDSKSLAKVETGEDGLIEDKVEKYEEELKPMPEVRTRYRYGNKLHYGYYDKRSKTFKIVEFAQN
ncbi:hypothetical protein [Botryobacter ruber]|uniref:hypothetical protein n=1 Tax=Botryobacter ruber TaxID=2171629 RepID=UPI000E0A9D8F|nr:hypothetical protein [Botryobacter ruber]